MSSISKRIVYFHEDRTWITAPCLDPAAGIDTEAKALARALSRVPQDAVGIRVIDASEVPTDRSFRDALKPDFTYDMKKSKEICKQKIPSKDAEIDAATTAEQLKAFLPKK